MSRAAMGFNTVNYGGVTISTMAGDEPGYATDLGQVKLQSIMLSVEAVEMIRSGKAVRILEDGTVESIEGELPGLIVFGRFKGDRPIIGGKN